MLARSVFIVIFTGFIPAVFAHHGVTQHYDPDTPVSLNAVVTSVEFVNPHAYVYFDVSGENGESEAWRCEMSAATTLRRRGWDKETLSAGQSITVNGSLARREDRVCVVTSLVLEDGLEVSRATDLSDYKKTEANSEVSSEELVELSEQQRINMATAVKPDFSGRWMAVGVAFSGRTGADGMAGMRGGGGATANVSATKAGLAAAEGYDGNFDNPNLHCRASDIIMAIQRDSHVNEIVDSGDTIQMNFGYMDVNRTIHMNMNAHPDDIVPSLEGHSIGMWEGPTLIIDTVGFLPSTYGGNGNFMTSEQMHITERFEFDSEEAQLQRHYTVEDSLFLNGTISGTQNLLMTTDSYEEYGCKELSGSNNQRS